MFYNFNIAFKLYLNKFYKYFLVTNIYTKFKNRFYIKSMKTIQIIKITFLCFLILNIINYTKCTISPISHKPIELIMNDLESTKSLTLKFTIDKSDIQAFYQNHVIAVKFPLDIVTLDVNNINNCSLTNYNDNFKNIINTSAYYSNESDPSTIFCQLTDTLLVNGYKNQGYFALNLLLNAEFKSNAINKLEIFYATSVLKDRIVLSKNINFGKIGLYNSYVAEDSSKLLKIISHSISNYTPSTKCINIPCKELYPYSDFTFNIQLEVTDNIMTKYESYIFFEFGDYFKNRSYDNISVYSNKFNDSSFRTIESGLNSITNLKLTYINGGFALDNLSEDLLKGRKFSLSFVGFKTEEAEENSIINYLSVKVIYKNTYSIISYDESKGNAFDYKVSSLDITIPQGLNWSGISHPEFNDIYENSSWPIKFIFVAPKAPNGGIFTINHNSNENSVFNFFASTCDFTEELNSNNLLINNEFGSRPVCKPETIKTKLSANDEEKKVESSLRFELPKSESSKLIILTVWGVALKCGSEDILTEQSNVSNFLSNLNKSKLTSELSFNYLFKSKNNKIIAKLDDIKLYGKCYKTVVSHVDNEDSNVNSMFNTSKYIANNNNYVSLEKDLFLYKEFFDWNLSSNVSALFNESNEEIKNEYLFTNKKDVVNREVQFYTDKRSEFEIPLPVYYSENDTYNTYKGKLNINLSSSYITKNKDIKECNMSWYTNSQSNKNTVYQINSNDNLKFDSFSNLNYKNKSEFTYNQPINISTKIINSDNNITFVESPKTVLSIGFKTNCYYFKSYNDILVKSIYSYIDFSYRFDREVKNKEFTSYVPTRMGRFIKFYLNSQVFNSETNNVINSENPFKFYYAFSANNSDNYNYCILSVSKTLFTNLNNAFLINLINNPLPDVSVEDNNTLSNTYPAAPLVDNVNVHYFNTEYPFNSKYSDANSRGQLNFSLSDILDDGNKISSKSNRNSLIKTLVTNGSSKSYYSYLGSTIIITGINNSKITSDSISQTDLLIPIYCPEEYKNNNTNSYIPNSISFSSFSYNNNKFNSLSNNIMFFKKPSSDTVVYSLVNKTGKNINDNNNILNPMSLQFNNYSLNDKDKIDVLKTTLEDEYLSYKDCDAILLFTNNLDISNNLKFNDFRYNALINNKFIIDNKVVDTIGFFIFGETKGDLTSSNSFKGITRPSYSMDESNTLANVFCVKNEEYLTADNNNYLIEDAPILENKEDSIFFKLEILDNEKPLYNNDLASSIKFKVILEKTYKGTAKLSLKSSSFYQESVCGIYYLNSENNNVLEQCLYLEESLSCKLNLNGETQDIVLCCNNIKLIENSITIDLESTLKGRYIDTNLLNSVVKSFEKVEILDDIIKPVIDKISYTQSEQINGLGVSLIRVDLKRPVVSNQRIKIEGEFSNLFIDNNYTNCIFSYMNKNDKLDEVINYFDFIDNGNYLIDKCELIINEDLQVSITLYNKNIFNKCDTNHSNYVTIALYPIIIKDLSIIDNNKYSITSAVNSLDKLNYIASDPDLADNKFINFEFNQNLYKISDPEFKPDMCDLISIEPKIIGVEALFLFKINYEKFSSSLNINDNKPPNEISIYMDINQFQRNNYLVCMHDNIILQCEWTKYGFINIKLNNSISSTESIIISIAGIKNPEFTENNSKFYCSINYYDYILNTRENIILGNGINKDITYNNIITNNILFINQKTLDPYYSYNLPNKITNIKYTPRSTNTLEFEFKFDYFASKTIVFDNDAKTSVLLVELPKEIEFIKYINNLKNIKVTLSKILFKKIINTNSNTDNTHSNSSSILENIFLGKETMYENPISMSIGELLFYNNFIKIPIDEKLSDVFNKDIGYFDMKIEHIPTPQNSVRTSAVNIYILDNESNINFMFLSYPNLNNYIKEIASSYNWYQAPNYEYSRDIALINVYEKDKINLKNVINIVPGRYTEVIIKVTGDIANASAYVLLEKDGNNIISSMEEKVLVDTGINNTVLMHIGTDCLTKTGIYYRKILLENNESKFHSSPIIKIIVERSSLFNSYNLFVNYDYSFTNDTSTSIDSLTIPKSSSIRVYINSNYYLYNGFEILLERSSVNINANTNKILLNKNTKSASFIISTSDIDSKNKEFLTLISSSKCFNFNNQNLVKKLSINIQDTAPTIKNIDLLKKIKYVRLDKEEKINTILINYKSPIKLTTLYCILACKEAKMPSSIDIVNNIDQLISKQSSYFRLVVYNGNTDTNLKFDNLLRGIEYKLKCVLTNNKIDPELIYFEKSELEILEDTDKPQTIKLNIKDVEKNKYIKYSFEKEQNKAFYNNLLISIQNFIKINYPEFSIVVKDSKGNTVEGITYDKLKACKSNLISELYINKSIKPSGDIPIKEIIKEEDNIEVNTTDASDSSNLIDSSTDSTNNNDDSINNSDETSIENSTDNSDSIKIIVESSETLDSQDETVNTRFLQTILTENTVNQEEKSQSEESNSESISENSSTLDVNNGDIISKFYSDSYIVYLAENYLSDKETDLNKISEILVKETSSLNNILNFIDKYSNIDKNNINGYFKVENIVDEPIDSKQILFKSVNYESELIEFVINTNARYQCYWKINKVINLESGKHLDEQEIKNCKNDNKEFKIINDCGMFLSAIGDKKVSQNVGSLEEGNYFVDILCTNNLPESLNKVIIYNNFYVNKKSDTKTSEIENIVADSNKEKKANTTGYLSLSTLYINLIFISSIILFV